jgi:hypothetical protein
MLDKCVFCRKSPAGSKEHVIPDALGGWLTTRDLCKYCNNCFGAQVDCTVVDYSVVRPLRQEASLVTKVLAGEYYNPELDVNEPVLVTPDGRIQLMQPVVRSGSSVYVRGRDAAHVEREAARLIRRYEQRGISVTSGPITVDGPRTEKFEHHQNAGAIERFKSGLGREAAKVAVEYIAMIASPAVALRAELDPLRSHALHGGDNIQVKSGFVGPPRFWLPRIRQMVTLAPSRPLDWSASNTKSLAPEELGPPPGVPHRTHLAHWVGVWRDRDGAHLSMELFSCFRATIALPSDFPLPWGRIDWRAFLPRREGTSYV